MSDEFTLATVIGFIAICTGVLFTVQAIRGVVHEGIFTEDAESKKIPAFIIAVVSIIGIVLITTGAKIFNEYGVISALIG